MDSRGGGCCIARYNNNGGGYTYDMSKVNRILLKYRPIAPKPAALDSTLKISAEEAVKGCNKRRKNVQNGNKKRKVSKAVVTLQLLPDSPEKKESPVVKNSPVWLSFDENNNSCCKNVEGCHVTNHVSGSFVKVESIAYTWVDDLNGLGGTDNEKVMSLENDTCPGFISDGSDRVVWVNGAYKEMFGKEREGGVWLGLKDGMELGGVNYGGFTCQVRVVTWGEGNGIGKNRASMTLPCDVWKMDFGGFAWRLDTKAALSLGR